METPPYESRKPGLCKYARPRSVSGTDATTQVNARTQRSRGAGNSRASEMDYREPQSAQRVSASSTPETQRILFAGSLDLCGRHAPCRSRTTLRIPLAARPKGNECGLD